jgi:hypothetical protein
MKKIFIILCCFIAIQAQAQERISATKGQTYGKKITKKGAIKFVKLQDAMKTKTEWDGKVKGVITSVCEKKGCWMKMKSTDGNDMMVRFKNYAFFMPMDIVGKTVVADGKAIIEVTSVEDLQHYAEDAGKSKEEIAKITEPKKEITFEAEGILVIN